MKPDGGSVLVVDDAEINRDLLSWQLQIQGLTTSVAYNGRHALELIRALPFDLMLLDIMMPEMNGYQVLEQLKADPTPRYLPVVVISGVDDLDSVVQLLNVLPKPIADRLKQAESAIADSFAEVTVLFADIVDFSEYSAGTPPVKLLDLLNEIFSTFDQLAEQYGLEKIKTIGDAYMVAGGLPIPRSDHAEAVAEKVTTAWSKPVMASLLPWTSCGVEGRARLCSIHDASLCC